MSRQIRESLLNKFGKKHCKKKYLFFWDVFNQNVETE